MNGMEMPFNHHSHCAYCIFKYVNPSSMATIARTVLLNPLNRSPMHLLLSIVFGWLDSKEYRRYSLHITYFAPFIKFSKSTPQSDSQNARELRPRNDCHNRKVLHTAQTFSQNLFTETRNEDAVLPQHEKLLTSANM